MAKIDATSADLPPLPSDGSGDNGGDTTLHVVVEEGVDPALQEWMDQFMIDGEEDLALDHDIPPAPITANQIFDLLNTYVEPKPYGPENLPLSYAKSIWKPPAEEPDPGDDRRGPKHNAKHQKLGMFHR